MVTIRPEGHPLVTLTAGAPSLRRKLHGAQEREGSLSSQ